MEAEELHWYAFHALRNSKKYFADCVKSRGIETFNNKVISSVIFVRTPQAVAESLRSEFYMYACPYFDPQTKKLSVIDDKEMETFIFVLTNGYERLDSVDPSLCKGDKVRVIGGLFKNAEGYIVRVDGTKRFVVCINGVAAVATSYIPKDMLQKIQ